MVGEAAAIDFVQSIQAKLDCGVLPAPKSVADESIIIDAGALSRHRKLDGR